MLFLALLFSTAAAADEFILPNVQAEPGSIVSIPIYLQNDRPILGFQLALFYPEGFVFNKVTKGDRLASYSSLPGSDRGNHYRLMCIDWSGGLVVDDAGFGELVCFKFKVPDNASGVYDISLKNQNDFMNKIEYEDNDYAYLNDVYATITIIDKPCSSIEIDKTSVVLSEGETTQLTATVLPDNATNKMVNWVSSDASVASVDETGLVTAIMAGSATITASTTDGSNLSASCVVTVTEDLSGYDNFLSMPNTEVLHGETIVIPVRLTNEETIVAFQTDIYLPEGFLIVADEDDDPVITPSSRLTGDHIIMADLLNDGAVRVICYNPTEQAINGNEGDLFYFTVAVPDDAAGNYTINLRNSRLTKATEYTELRIPDASAVLTVNTYIPGDANDSRTVTVTDIVVTAQYILQRNPNPFIFEAADMNGDGEVTVTDIMLIANLINHPAMNAPRRAPALMVCNDRLSGESVRLNVGETRTVSILLDNEMDYSAFQFDLTLPEGLRADNFALTDRAGSHALDVNAIDGGKLRALCYSPAIEVIGGHNGALLTFDVTATDKVNSDITVDGIELVTTDCQTVRPDAFAIGVSSATSVNEIAGGKTVARVDYFNVAGQQVDRPDNGVTIVITTYSDGTRTTTKILQ